MPLLLGRALVSSAAVTAALIVRHPRYHAAPSLGSLSLSCRAHAYPVVRQLMASPNGAEPQEMLLALAAKQEQEDEDGPVMGMAPIEHSAFSSPAAAAAATEAPSPADPPASAPLPMTEKELRKLRKKEAKAHKRARRTGEVLNLKPCNLCQRDRDLLVRCQIDNTLKWYMVCGRCWKDVSGGVVDGDAVHPHYRYGGLWKAH